MTNKINFTKKALQNLPIPESGERTTFHDTKIRGLQLRVTHSGTKTFNLFRRIKGGAPERVTLGRFPELTVEQARRRATEVNAAIEGGANPAEAKRAYKAEATFSDLFDEFMKRHSKPNKRTWKEDERIFHQYLREPLGNKKLSNITRREIAAIHFAISRTGKSSQANRVKALVSSIFSRGIEWDIVKNNPAQGIRANSEKSRDRFLQANELPQFFKAIAEEPNEIIRDYFLVSLLVGARRGNVLSMSWSDIDLDDALWRIEETKNGTPQNIPLVDEVVDLLKIRKKNRDSNAEFVFPGKGRTGHLVEPKTGWKRILKRADIGNLRIHDLRRTLGSWQAKTGASLAIIGKSLNHKTPQATLIYARLDIDPVREALDKATSAMLKAGKIKVQQES